MSGEYTRALQDLHVKLDRVLLNQDDLARLIQLTWRVTTVNMVERSADREEVNSLVKRILS